MTEGSFVLAWAVGLRVPHRPSCRWLLAVYTRTGAMYEHALLGVPARQASQPQMLLIYSLFLLAFLGLHV